MDKLNEFKIILEIRNRQRILNKRYKEEGLTDEILEEQLEINKLRNEYDVVDDSEVVYDGFVQ